MKIRGTQKLTISQSLSLRGIIFMMSNAASFPIYAFGETTRISLDSTEGQGKGQSYSPSMSADGRFVTFYSSASNLVADDTNSQRDIFIRDRFIHKTLRVSEDNNGNQGNFNSFFPAISADGRFVAFYSYASNLVSNDSNGQKDIFLHNRIYSTTTRVSVDDTNVQGNDYSFSPTVSADGRYVAFSSRDDTLVSGDTNGMFDIFVRDRVTKLTTCVSVNNTGIHGNDYSFTPNISANGRYVVFRSWANNLVANDTNNVSDIFIHDQLTHTTSRVSLDSTGIQGNHFSESPAINADGRYVVFESFANNLVADDSNGWRDIFIRDRIKNKTTRISLNSTGGQGNNHSKSPSISADGRFVAFESFASNLVADDTNSQKDIFIRDRFNNTTTRVSLNNEGIQGNNHSLSASVSVDGRFVAFRSSANNLVSDDTNEQGDIFIHDRYLRQTKANLVLTQTTSSNGEALGNIVTYTVTVKNLGPDSAGQVTLTDIVPLYGQLLSITPSKGGCYKGPIAICRMGILAKNKTATVTVQIKSTQKGYLKNQASVNAAQIDLAPLNNSSVKSVKVQ